MTTIFPWLLVALTWMAPAVPYARANLLACVCLYYVIAMRPRWHPWLQSAIVWILAINTIAAICHAVGWIEIPQAAGPAGLMANRNLLGSLIAVGLPVSIGTCGVFVAIPCLCLLLFATSRASMLALAATAIFWLWIRFKGSSYRWQIVMAATCSLLGVVYLMLSVWHGALNSAKERVDLSYTGIHLIIDKPIIGWGLGLPGMVYPPATNGVQIQLAPQNPLRIHNDWIQFGVEYGIFGLAMLLSLWLSWIFNQSAPLHVRLSLFALGVNAAMDFPLQMPVGFCLFWVLGGMAMSGKVDSRGTSIVGFIFAVLFVIALTVYDTSIPDFTYYPRWQYIRWLAIAGIVLISAETLWNMLKHEDHSNVAR